MYLKRILIIVLSIFCFAGLGMAQKVSSKTLKKKGNLFYGHKKYAYALPYLLKYQEAKPKDLEAKLRIGICYFHTNRMEQAETYLEYMAQQKKPEIDAIYYLARTYHLQHRFREAIKYYKKYLAELESGDNRKFPVKDNIRRCARGIKLQYSDKLALVENLGDKVNTSTDDFSPAMNNKSPSILYFSSIRSGNYGDCQDDFGVIDTIKGKYRADIFETKLEKGVWQLAERKEENFNTDAHDVIFGFNDKGDVVYYGVSKYLRFDYMNIYSKPFGEEKSMDIPFKFPVEINSGEWDSDPFFFNDSTVIFSSDRDGGFGGKDLYVSFKKENGRWNAPINMGEAINTPYDEISPFLAKDGKTFYYSSNNVKGMGDFDIYRSVFEKDNGGWSPAYNLGIPINSAGDDAYFKISTDGMRAYFASSRAEGYGGYDIHVAYFRRLMPEQLKVGQGLSFKKYITGEEDLAVVVKPVVKPKETGVIVKPKVEEPTTPSGPRFVFTPLFYQDYANLLLKPESVKELIKMKDLLINSPQLKIELTSHTDSYGPQNFNLQSSVSGAESIAEYLMSNGIKGERIIIKGCGQLYPIAQDTNEDGSENRQGRTLNRRVEMEVYGEQSIPAVVKTEIPDISSRLSSPEGKSYQTRVNGLSFRVQVKALKQMLDDDVLIRYPDALIETTAAIEIKRYSVGLSKSYGAAEKLRLKLVADGFKDAFIVAYIDGERKDKGDLEDFKGKYPQLVPFLED
ncbi:MAG: OmpA family protein [Saprospiraceae bacterium]